MAAHGFSIVELERRAGPAVALHSGSAAESPNHGVPFTLTSPAAGSDLVKTAADPTGRRVSGTIGNCSGSVTAGHLRLLTEGPRSAGPVRGLQ